ncbi:MAG: AAA family ATPase [Myxococcota bacterium]
MRLLSLDLAAFGPFTDRRVDLSGGAQGLHLIYGDNEAGKSSALRALVDLLYGIPHHSGDAHLHGGPRLSIGGTLQLRSGTALQIWRRKGTKHSLSGPDQSPLPESALEPFLGGLNRHLFLSMFAIDHPRLAEGAQGLLRADDPVGASLVSASLGTRALERVMDRLGAEADGLWTQRGKTRPKLKQTLREIDEAERRVKDAILTLDEWKRHQRDLEDFEKERAALSLERQAATAEARRLARLEQMLPLLQRLRALNEERASFLGLPAMGVDADALRQRAEAELLETSRLIDSKRSQRARLYAEEAALDRAPAVLAAIAEIGGLAEQLVAVREAEAALPGLRSEVDRLSALLGPEAPASAPLEPSEIARRLEQARRLGRQSGVDAELASATQSIVELVARLGERAARCRAWVLPGFDPERSPLPSTEALAVWMRRQEELEREARALDERGAEKAQQRLELERSLLVLEKSGALPSEAELEESRRERGLALEAVLDPWSRGQAFDPERALRLQQKIDRADGLSDRLRREQRAISERAAQEAALFAARRAEELGAEERAKQGERARVFLEDFRKIWPPEVAVSGGPAAMSTALEELMAWRTAAAELGAARRREEAAIEARRRALAQAELPATDVPLAELAERLEREASQQQRAAVLAERRRALSAAEQRVKQFRAEVEALWSRISQEPLTQTPDRALETLRLRARAVERDAASEARIKAEILGTSAELAEAEAKHRSAEEVMAELYRISGAPDRAALLEHLEKDRRRRQIEDQARALEQHILALGQGADLSALWEEARAISGAELDQARAAQEARSAALDARIQALDQEIGRVKEIRGGVAKRAGAIEPSEDLQALWAKARAELDQYLLARVSSLFLRRYVASYRNAHQAPILKRATELLARLSLGSLVRLGIELDEADQPRFIALRSDGTRRLVAELSDGARDQLYLALRLATLEEWLDRGEREPLPFVVDDILVNFDDARAQATLEVLSELSDRTQVLLFTHHQRLADLAQQAVRPGRLFLHRL